MPLSNQFIVLKKRLSELRKHMLPRKFSPTGTYTSRVEDYARGYRLLVHAEIESYLEERARSVVTDRVRAWKNSSTPSNLLLAFIACYHSGWVDYDEKNHAHIINLSKSRKKINKKVDAIIDLAQTQFVQSLNNNHGVREKNLKTLFHPTGIDLSELDAVWLADLDDFGLQRGIVAHSAKMTTAGINPKDEYERVKALLIGLKDLDERLSQVI